MQRDFQTHTADEDSYQTLYLNTLHSLPFLLQHALFSHHHNGLTDVQACQGECPVYLMHPHTPKEFERDFEHWLIFLPYELLNSSEAPDYALTLAHKFVSMQE